MKTTDAARARPFLDHVDALVTRVGMPTGVGRLLGWLMIGDPSCQTVAEIAQATDLPPDALEAMLTGLVTSETVERVTLPDQVSPCYALRSPQELIARRSRQLRDFIGLMDEAMALTKDGPPEVHERLASFRDLYERFTVELDTMSSTPEGSTTV